LKKILTIILLLSSFSGFSQANYFQFGIGLQGGISTAYTGLSYEGAMIASNPLADKKLGTNKSRTFGGSLDYYVTPFISAGLEYNMVQLKDGPDQYNRQFISDFSNIELRGNIAAGQFFDYSYNPLIYALRNVNLSLGIGMLSGKNNVAEYTETDKYPRRQHANDLGQSKFNTVLNLPMTIGYRFNVYDAYNVAFLQVGINYKMVFTFSDDIDGFNDNPLFFENNSKDAFTTLGFSVKYLFGPTKLFYR
jgi:hypothetical protein